MLRSSSLFLALVCIGPAACGGGSKGASNGAGAASGSGGASGNSSGTGASGTAAGTAGVTSGAGTTGATTGAASGGNASGSTSGTGSTGAAGASGTSGTATGGAGDGGTTHNVVMSAGCNKPTTEQPSPWNRHDIMVTAVAAAYTANFTNRTYWTKPPLGYDMTRAYSLVIWGQGCGQGPTPEAVPPSENPGITGSATAPGNAVIVQLLASQGQQNHCYSAGPDGDNADSPEIPYFDQVVAEVEAAYCIDKSRVFEGGYSSGGWEAGLMSCVRTNVLRGTGWAAAGLQINHDPCMGPVAALITRGVSDPGTPLAETMAAIESLRMRNGCGTTTKPWTPTWNPGETPADTSTCVTYDGCTPGYPLVWCPTPGGHTNTEGDTHLTRYGLWKLWSTLP